MRANIGFSSSGTSPANYCLSNLELGHANSTQLDIEVEAAYSKITLGLKTEEDCPLRAAHWGKACA